MQHSDDETNPPASPACLLHQIDPAYAGLPPATASDVAAWRKTEREALIAHRMAIAPETRQRWSNIIAGRVAETVGDFSGKTVSFYWPFRGEPDLRPLMETVWQAGGQALLPVVLEKRAPLVFKPWRQGDALTRGVWNIPIPETGMTATPEVVIAPVVGYDPLCFRLGYGGGFFDRTLAAMARKPLVIGVGYSLQAIATIHPQPHDIAMSTIVTETEAVVPAATAG